MGNHKCIELGETSALCTVCNFEGLRGLRQVELLSTVWKNARKKFKDFVWPSWADSMNFNWTCWLKWDHSTPNPQHGSTTFLGYFIRSLVCQGLSGIPWQGLCGLPLYKIIPTVVALKRIV